MINKNDHSNRKRCPHAEAGRRAILTVLQARFKEVSQEVEKAVEFAATLTGEPVDYPLIIDETAKISDSKRLSALLSLWKHYRYKMNDPRTYKEFIGLYNNFDNKGVI